MHRWSFSWWVLVTQIVQPRHFLQLDLHYYITESCLFTFGLYVCHFVCLAYLLSGLMDKTLKIVLNINCANFCTHFVLFFFKNINVIKMNK